MNGYIKLHRKILNWQWFGVTTVRDLFVYLLLKASYKDTYWKGILIQKGQVPIGLHETAKILGFSVQQIRTAIDKLKSTNEITVKSTSVGTIITIVNWEEYQSENIEDNNQNNKQDNISITNEQQTNNKRITTIEEYKEYKEYKEIKELNNKNIYDHFDWESKFEEFWIEYPKKVARQKCEEKFKKICTTEESFSAIMTGLRKYNELKYQFIDTQYIPNPLTWLNQQRWNDEIEDNSKRAMILPDYYTNLPEITHNESLDIIDEVEIEKLKERLKNA